MTKDKVFDPELDAMLAELASDSMSEARAANTTEEVLGHLKVVKECTDIRKDISCDIEEPKEEPTEEVGWWDQKVSNRQFIKDLALGIAGPLLGLAGVLLGAKISANSNEEIARINCEARTNQLKQLMKYEETDSVSKHEIDVINGLNR